VVAPIIGADSHAVFAYIPKNGNHFCSPYADEHFRNRNQMNLGPFSSDDVKAFLAEYGYTTHPKGMAAPFWPDCESESQTVAWFDVHADAVRRKDGEVPDRPIRITFHKVFDGSTTRWKLKSVEELPPGVKSKALDRQPETPKQNAPWPD
jgi:hypothetical protein